jgi:hypothetical protein
MALMAATAKMAHIVAYMTFTPDGQKPKLTTRRASIGDRTLREQHGIAAFSARCVCSCHTAAPLAQADGGQFLRARIACYA